MVSATGAARSDPAHRAKRVAFHIEGPQPRRRCCGAIPHLARTNETIQLARRGDWPPITGEGAEFIAYKWRCSCPAEIQEYEFSGDPVFRDDAAFTASLTAYLAEHWPFAKHGTRAFDEIKGYARGECRIETFERVRPVQVGPDGKEREPVLLNHPDPAGSDLIREWA